MPYTAEQRRKKREEGRCVSCLKRMTEDGKVTCRICRPKMAKHSRNSQQRRRDAGLCISCGKNPPVGNHTCSDCAGKRNQRWRDRSASGKCVARAKCTRERLPDCGYCDFHWFEMLCAVHKLGGLSSVPMLMSLWDKQYGLCALTGKQMTRGDSASLDHIVPTARGGSNDPSNLRFVCLVVNRMKSDQLDAELLDNCRLILSYAELLGGQ